MRKIVPIILIIALLVSCNAKRAEHSAAVQVEVLTIDSISEYASTCYIGYVEAEKETNLFSMHSGRITRVCVREGDRVQEGQVIAEIESQSVRSALAASEASLRQAEDGLKRARQVYETHSIAEVQLIEIETKVEQARAAAAASRKALEECRIKAPYAGVVSGVSVNVGEEVAPATQIATVMDVSDVRVKISVPERDINKLQVGDTAMVVVPSLERRLRAVVTNKGVVGSPLSHTYGCQLKFVVKVTDLVPGMMCKVYPSNQGTSGVVVIPADVVRMDNRGKYVWCVNPDSTVCKKYISLGDFVGRGVIVSTGLTFGDMVITEGTQKVSTGMKVKY